MICIVIPVHNRKKFTEECLHSLKRQTVPADFIIIVDDGSTDGTDDMISQQFPDVIILTGDGNLFWTAAINLGIKLALALGTDYVLTLNNDTVASEDFIERMTEKANPHILIGALDIDIDTKQTYYGGEKFSWKSGKSEYLLDAIDEDEQNGLHEVSLFPGRGLLIPSKVFETIGLFAEKQLPHYLADYDFTQKANRNGFRIFCNYDAKLYTYPGEGTDHKIRSRKSLGTYFNHLFSIRGGGNLKYFTIYTLRNCPAKDIPIALMSGYIRRIGGFWLR